MRVISLPFSEYLCPLKVKIDNPDLKDDVLHPIWDLIFQPANMQLRKS